MRLKVTLRNGKYCFTFGRVPYEFDSFPQAMTNARNMLLYIAQIRMDVYSNNGIRLEA